MRLPTPSQRERMALFRLGVIGDLLSRELLTRGELQSELQERAKKRYRPPGATKTRTYSWKRYCVSRSMPAKTGRPWLNISSRATVSMSTRPTSCEKDLARCSARCSTLHTLP